MDHRSSFALLLVLSLSACGGASDKSSLPQDATGETHIKYVICGDSSPSCFVAARFNDLDGCERHKKWSGMLCDSQSSPGMMTCREDKNPIGTDYCTR